MYIQLNKFDSMKIFVETERLILREILPSDDKGMFALDSDKDVHKYLGNKPIETIEQARQIVDFVRQQYIDNGIGRWAIIDKVTNEFMGWTGLKLVKESTNNHINYYDLGYRLIKKYWGQGYATETAKASIDYGFNNLNLTKIFGTADINNIASRKVLEKAGLKYIETFDRGGIPNDWFSIIRLS